MNLSPKPVAKHTGLRGGAERAAEAVEAVHRDRMNPRVAAKTSDIFVGSLQKRVSGSASKADGVGPRTVMGVRLTPDFRLRK